MFIGWTRSPAVRAFVAAVFVCALQACAGAPHRPYVKATAADIGCKAPVADSSPQHKTTPEVSLDPPYTLHYLEFDDQGWAYPNPKSDDPRRFWSPGYQIDCAIADLAYKVERGTVRSFVYVHGWHHSAEEKDRDLEHFHDFLKAQGRNGGSQVVGFYVSWDGDTVHLPLLKYATFWSRKNAAHHVSEGSVREFFSRIKTLRNHWNNPDNLRSANCGKPQAATEGRGCPLKTVMMGHSFGALVLFSATSPYLLDTLAGNVDLPEDAGPLPAARERGVADLVVLLNPAFEAGRYEALHRAARNYRHSQYETPLLVSVTSTADWATKTAFPLARFFNSIFQYPATTNEESHAMKHTHGHIDAYLTHELTLDPDRASHDEASQRTCVIDKARHTTDRQTLRQQFFDAATGPDGTLQLPADWVREMCGGLTLTSLPKSHLGPYSIVWNVRTFENIIKDHNDITTWPLKDFVEQVYGDLVRAPHTTLARAPHPAAPLAMPPAAHAAVAAAQP